MVLYTIYSMEDQAQGLVAIKTEEVQKKCKNREDITK